MSQRFDGNFAKFVRKELDDLCTEFINSVPYAMAEAIQKEYPDLPHSNIMDAVSKVVRPSDGSEDKACEWFEMSEQDIIREFEEEFPDEDDFFEDEDEDDDWDDDDNSDAYVAHVERVEQEAMSDDRTKSLEERRPDIYTRYIRWLGGDNDGYDEFVYFSSKGSQPGEEYSGENDPDDELIHFYGLKPEDAVPGYTNGEWVIVRY